MKEIFKDIPNYEGLYQVSNLGRIKSLYNLEWCSTAYNNTYGTRIERVTYKTGKRILQYDLNGNFIKEYKSVSEASRLNKIKSAGNISMCCTNKYKQAGGYIWKYKGVV